MQNEPTNPKTRLEEIYREYDSQREELLADLFKLLSFESISTEPAHAADMQNCVGWLRDHLNQLGFETELWDYAAENSQATPQLAHPTLYASWLKAGPSKPTVLIYNHYDVQPVSPLSDWHSPPFAPTVRDGKIYARGAVDNKGQLAFVLAALKNQLKNNGTLPVNLKLVIEGEEEAGSITLLSVLKKYQSKLKADHCLVVDLALNDPEIPSVVLGVRGIVAFELELTGSSTDLHSGGHGGIVYNPNRAMVEMMAALRDSRGRIAIPGFYEDVMELNAAERKLISFAFDAARYSREFGAEPTGGESDYSPLEGARVRPSLEINGLAGGYAGEGFKTVIPAKAVAKFSCRIVPNQKPEKIGQLVEKFLQDRLPPGIQMKLNIHHGGEALRSDPAAGVVQAAALAFSEVFDKKCDYILEGGSIPVVGPLLKASNAAVALIGVGLPTDGWHAANEHFGLDRLRKGFAVITRILDILGG